MNDIPREIFKFSNISRFVKIELLKKLLESEKIFVKKLKVMIIFLIEFVKKTTGILTTVKHMIT